MGEIGYQLNHPEEEIVCTKYFPTTLSPELKGSGFESFAELQILRHLRKQFPRYLIRSTKTPDTGRAAQLRKRGWRPGDPISMTEAIKLTTAHVRRNTLKHQRPK
jgi:hypothetical protein